MCTHYLSNLEFLYPCHCEFSALDARWEDSYVSWEPVLEALVLFLNLFSVFYIAFLAFAQLVLCFPIGV
jgi:hypothetical protein